MPGTAAKKPAPRRSASGRGVSGTKKKVAAKKPTAKRTAKKTTSAKRGTVKKPTKKTPAKASGRKPAANKAGKKTAPKKATPKKTAKKAPAKTTPKKAGATKAAPAAKKAAPAPAAPAAKAKPAFPPLPSPASATTKGRGGKKTILCPLSGFEVTPSPANLSPKTLERLRQKLLDEKVRLRHQAEELTAEAEQLAREREAGDTQFDEESGEGDTVNIERERDLLLSATARQVVEEIDDAIERIKKNKYGVCKPAGRKISLERLEAIPWAQVCVDCKARAERRR
jgi:RNA polymerase-binding protein DksA